MQPSEMQELEWGTGRIREPNAARECWACCQELMGAPSSHWAIDRASEARQWMGMMASKAAEPEMVDLASE